MITALRSFSEPVFPEIGSTDLAALLGQVVNEISAKTEEKGRVSLVIEEQLPQIPVDPAQIADAVQELVRNAFEADPSTQVEVRVQIDRLDGRLKIQVSDNGPGLSEHALAHAFDPFFSEKPAGRQPGLGLAVAQRLVEAHDGRLTLENNPAGGATATIWLSTVPADRQRDVA